MIERRNNKCIKQFINADCVEKDLRGEPELISDKTIGVSFMQKKVIDEDLHIHDISFLEFHNCEDGSFGFADFQGFKKVEE